MRVALEAAAEIRLMEILTLTLVVGVQGVAVQEVGIQVLRETPEVALLFFVSLFLAVRAVREAAAGQKAVRVTQEAPEDHLRVKLIVTNIPTEQGALVAIQAEALAVAVFYVKISARLGFAQVFRLPVLERGAEVQAL